MSIILASLLIGAATAAASGYVARRRRVKQEATQQEREARQGRPADPAALSTADAERAASAASSGSASARGGKVKRTTDKATELPGFPCQLGDVIMRRIGDEAWLEGGLVFSEDAPVSALFVAPEGKELRGIYVRPQPTLDVFWLAPVPATMLAVGGEPPTSIEHDAQRYERTRRLPLRSRRIGTGAPDVGETVLCAEYTGPGAERMIILVGDGGARSVWVGEALYEGMYDVLGGGASTLEP
jgi:hypothetical protein